MNDFTDALVWDEQSSIIPEQDDYFGKLIGSWDFDYVDNNNPRTVIGEWHFQRVLEGAGVQDVFICPSRATRLTDFQPDGEYGTTLRMYNPATQTWDVAYCRGGEMVRLEAKREGDKIVLTNLADETEKWVFVEITDSTFHWQNVSVCDDGTWHVNSDIFAKRMTADGQSELTDRDVRIVYLPPADVAAYRYEGDDPEKHVHAVMDTFVRETGLPAAKPDLRHFGFNSPNPTDESGRHGYEVWVTIPDNFTVPEPLAKKHFPGGLYGARMIPFGEFEEWARLDEWMRNNARYEYRGDGDYRNMFGLLEEHLNYVNRVFLPDPEVDGCQLDLLVPIQVKESQ